MNEGFVPSKAEPEIWIRPSNGSYEYIAVYVDDLAIAVRDPQAFIHTLTEKYKFKLKGTCQLGSSGSYHLGMDFTRNHAGKLLISPTKYIDKMMATYQHLFGEKPKHIERCRSPLVPGDHPELDTTDFLDEDGTAKYQSLIGSMQWLISITRFDIAVAVVSLSSFRATPRKGHLDRAKRIYSYIRRMDQAAITINTELPDYSQLPDQSYSWADVYGNLKEEFPKDAPKPLGNPVITTTYHDANLMHDLLTGRSMMGILHFINKTPIEWFAKKTATVETATYRLEFVSARTAVEQIIDLRTTLRYLGVPVHDTSYLFGDNKSVVDSSTIPHSKLHKRHTLLSFHRVRETIASGMVAYHHIPGSSNPSDVLSKHWAYPSIWPLLRPIMFAHKD